MAFYDQLFARSPTRFGQDMNLRIARMHWGELCRFAQDYSSLVEIGPGRGEFAATCLPMVQRYSAVDVNEQICRMVRDLGGTAICATVPPLPFASNSAAIVYASSVIEHMPDPGKALQLLEEMKRVAQPGGLVAVHAPDILACGNHFWNSEYSHAFPTSRRRLLQMASDTGLVVLRTEYCYGPFRGFFGAALGGAMRLFFSDHLASWATLGLVAPDRFYKTRTALLRSILLIARKPPLSEGKAV